MRQAHACSWLLTTTGTICDLFRAAMAYSKRNGNQPVSNGLGSIVVQIVDSFETAPAITTCVTVLARENKFSGLNCRS